MQSAAEIGSLWPNLIAMALADQEVILLLHCEVARHWPTTTTEWLSDGVNFERIAMLQEQDRFTVDAVVRACAAIAPRCRGLNVYLTTGSLAVAIENQRRGCAENPIVIMTKDLLWQVAAKPKTDGL